MDEIKDWVMTTPEELQQIDPGSKKRPIPKDLIEEGVFMVGPFILDGPKAEDAKGEIYTNLRFLQRGDQKIMQVGSTNLVHEYEIMGRVRFSNGKLRAITDHWGEVSIRAITPKDAYRFNAKFSKTPTVEQLVDAFWPDEEED